MPIHTGYGRVSSQTTRSAGSRPKARVLRGGSWNNNAINARSANRNRNAPADRNQNYGFRLASTSRRTGL